MTSARPRLTRSEALHQQVARHIRNDIAAGRLRDGDVLPSTRELAAEWGVSVFTISEAMKVLTAEGLVASKSRSKRVVTSPDNRNEVRLSRPQVLLIGGYAGSGKTELGRTFARQTGWPMLDKDTITRPVVEMALQILGLSPHDRESEQYLTQIRPTEYESLREGTLENVSCGNSVIATAPFIREFKDESWVAKVRADLAELSADVTLIWVYCDAGTMHSYVRHRGAARDTAKLADWPGYLSAIDLDFRPESTHVVVENCAKSRPLSEQAEELLRGILGEPEGPVRS
jgi:DNA-binding transcriptional regulator YhcF (GntR family)/predicted kinase